VLSYEQEAIPPEGAFWNQEASNIGDQRESQQTATMPVRCILWSRSGFHRSESAKRVNGYENRCKAMGFQLYALQKDSGF
jgi:hypothetical protein